MDNMTERRARKDLTVICSILVLVALGYTVLSIRSSKLDGASKIVAVVHLFFTLVSSYYVVREVIWAKWAMGILSLFGGASIMYLAIKLLIESIRTQVVNTFGLSIALVSWFYLFAGVYILVTIKKPEVDEEKR